MGNNLDIEKELLHLKSLIVKGNYDQANEKISQLKQLELDPLFSMELNILNSFLFRDIFKFEESLNIAKEVEIKSKSLSNYYYESRAILEQAYTLWRMGKIDNQSELIVRCENLLAKLNTRQELRIKSKLLFLKGNMISDRGEIQNALELYDEALDLYKQIDDKQGIASTLNNKATIYNLQGRNDEAFNLYQEGLAIFEEIGNKYDQAMILDNIADVYLFKGDLEAALDHSLRSLDIYQLNDYSDGIAYTLCTIGSIYYVIGDIAASIVKFKESLEIFEEINNEIWTSYVLYHLIQACLKLDLNDAKKYIDQLKSTKENNPNNKEIELRYNLCYALYLKQQKNSKSLVESTELLDKIISSEVIDAGIYLIAMYQLAEIYLIEYRLFNNQKIIDEVIILINKIEEFAISQNSYPNLIYVKILKSKIASINGEFEKADKILVEAKNVCKNHNLTLLHEMVNKEMSNLQEEFSKINQFVSESEQFSNKLDGSQVELYLQEIINKGIMFSTNK